jgi:hypothetical protein
MAARSLSRQSSEGSSARVVRLHVSVNRLGPVASEQSGLLISLKKKPHHVRIVPDLVAHRQDTRGVLSWFLLANHCGYSASSPSMTSFWICGCSRRIYSAPHRPRQEDSRGDGTHASPSARPAVQAPAGMPFIGIGRKPLRSVIARTSMASR